MAERYRGIVIYGLFLGAVWASRFVLAERCRSVIYGLFLKLIRAERCCDLRTVIRDSGAGILINQGRRWTVLR
ncbi:13738_t:CDS:1, partial [Racocetra persica]